MRTVLAICVLLAVVGTAAVTVCQRAQIDRLEVEVWQMERRRDRLERESRRLSAALSQTRTPRSLLDEFDRDGDRSRAAIAGLDALGTDLEGEVAPPFFPAPDEEEWR